jgi:hypothetical protein
MGSDLDIVVLFSFEYLHNQKKHCIFAAQFVLWGYLVLTAGRTGM